MERIETECVIIGAGVVGLAVARELAGRGLEVVILEREKAIGLGNSSRNSEVIHAGIYYPAGSLKASLCVKGRDLLYSYCAERGIAHRRLGKLIVATQPSEADILDALFAQATANGVDDLVKLGGDEATRLEPELNCAAALFSPSTGIIDANGYMLSLLGEAQARGAMLALHATVLGGRVLADGRTSLDVASDAAMEVVAPRLVNCAGLRAQEIASAIEGYPTASVPPLYLGKGNYFALPGKAPFRHLVYPIPEKGGLGIHMTLDLGGQARFGPDLEWVNDINFTVDAARRELFEQSIGRYWPGLMPGRLMPAHAGVRPKLSGPGSPGADFALVGPDQHGVQGHMHLFGIESPGLTSSLAIALAVANCLGA